MTAPLLIIGQSGQLARALRRKQADSILLGRDRLDLSWDENQLTGAFSAILEEHPVSGVINAAAYTQVDKAETEGELAFAVNGTAPGVLAKICADHSLPFVHISTDYVFNGNRRTPWTESDPTDPINLYGQSKLSGEQAVLQAGGQAAILRTSWVYDLEGKNFATTMLRLAKDRDQVSVVDDQIGRPTHADDLADSALAAIGHQGLFHVSGTGKPVSWAGFASAIFEAANLDMDVRPIPSSDYPTPATRPAWSVLDTSRFEAKIAPLRNWEDALKAAFENRRTKPE